MTEMEQLQYNDVMADLAAIIDKAGAGNFLHDFHMNYPKHYKEIVKLFIIEEKQAKVPRLLTKC